MTLSSLFTLFFSMIVLAAIPGPGILVVVSRALTGGFISGATVTVGILVGDYIFITLAFLGLSTLAHSFYEVFQYMKYIGALYLVYLGLQVLFASKKEPGSTKTKVTSHSVNVIAGLVTTLSNPKAILFYVSFFPAFLNSSFKMIDLALLYFVATIAIGGVMLGYAFFASKGKNFSKQGVLGQSLKYISGFTLVGCGALVAVKA